MRKRLRRAGPWLTGAYVAALVLCLVVTLVVCVRHPDARSSSIFGPILRTDAGEPLELPALAWANGAIWALILGRCVIELFCDDPEEDCRETSPGLAKQRRRADWLRCAACGGAFAGSILLWLVLGGAIWSYFAGQCILVVIGLSWDFRRWYLNRTAEGDG